MSLDPSCLFMVPDKADPSFVAILSSSPGPQMESEVGNHGAEVASSPPRESAHVVRGDAMKLLIGDIMTSRTIRLWSEIRTFKTLYESLQRLARDIYFKFIDPNSQYAIDGVSDNIREIIREKALRSASVLCFDTFDDLKSLLAVTLDKELAKRKHAQSPRRSGAPEIVFPRAAEKKKPKKEKELFNFLSDGDDDELEFRNEEQKLSEVGSALSSWYGQDWEKQLAKQKRKEKKEKERAFSAEAVGGSASAGVTSQTSGGAAVVSHSSSSPVAGATLSTSQGAVRLAPVSEEAFPGIPLHVAPPSQPHKNTNTTNTNTNTNNSTATTAVVTSTSPATTAGGTTSPSASVGITDSVVAFPGVPLHNEQESFEKLLNRRKSEMPVGGSTSASSSAPTGPAVPTSISAGSLVPSSSAAPNSPNAPSAPVREIVFPGIPLYSETERPFSPVSRPGSSSPHITVASSPTQGRSSLVTSNTASSGGSAGGSRVPKKDEEGRPGSPFDITGSPRPRETVIPPDVSPAFPGIPLRVIEPAALSSSTVTATVVAPSATSASSPASHSSAAPSGNTHNILRREAASSVMSSGGVRGAFSALHSSNKKTPVGLSDAATDVSTSPSPAPFPGIPVHSLEDRPPRSSRVGSGPTRVGLSSEDSAFPGIPVHVIGNPPASSLATSASVPAGNSISQANAKKD